MEECENLKREISQMKSERQELETTVEHLKNTLNEKESQVLIIKFENKLQTNKLK